MTSVILRKPSAFIRLLNATVAFSLVATPMSFAQAAPARGKSTMRPAAARPEPRPEPAFNILRAQRPSTELSLSVGRGQLINLPAPISDVFVANEGVADVQVRSATQIYVFAKAVGESSVFATSKSGAVIYSANVRAGKNVNSIDQMLKIAMPDAAITATTMNDVILLTGTVAGPDDSAEAVDLVQSMVGEGVKVISRLKAATPLQVNLQVKIAEVSRSLIKDIGVNLQTLDRTGGFQFGIVQGRTGAITSDPNTRLLNGFTGRANTTTLGGFGKFLGLDIGSALDLAETEGLVTTLAQPNLTALSGETASFLAGGEFPIPVSQDLGTVTVEYRQFGVSLAFTPVVLADGRISMRVRPEVSELSNEGSVRLNGFDVPALSIRRAETTVELGSGQSFMIGGLMRNAQTNSIDRAPGLGNVPVLGALFRSTRYRRSETELVIIVTPYLVKPVTAGSIALPTDGFKAATDVERVLFGRTQSDRNGGERPKPTMAPPATEVGPSIGAAQPIPGPAAPQPKTDRKSQATLSERKSTAVAAAPGFSGN